MSPQMRQAGSILAVLAMLVGGCDPSGAQTVELTLLVQSQGDVVDLQVVAIPSGFAATPERLSRGIDRTADELRADPYAAVLELEVGTWIVHSIGTTRSGETFVATRCYALNGSLTDDVVLVGPIGAIDLDGDGFVVDPPATCREPSGGGDRACEASDFVCSGGMGADCDDANGSFYPGARFICQNGIDEDCDGADEPCEDYDGDGFGACSTTPTPSCDCDDNNAGVNPGIAERATDAAVCLDGVDQDCDGFDACCDLDGDGYQHCRDSGGDCVDTADQCDNALAPSGCDPASINPGASEEPPAADDCDGIDNDCSGIADDSDVCRGGDLDRDGVPGCGREAPGAPCDPNDCDSGVRRGPDAREFCGDSIDEDGDGVAAPCDPADGDGDGDPVPRDCNDSDPFAYNHTAGDPVFDLCADTIPATCVPGEERDCAADTDGDGYVEPPECEGDASRGPSIVETCNGMDDDCDGVIDEVLDETGTVGCLGGRMVDFRTDPSHCGLCRNLCDEPGTVADVCDAGMCDCPTEPGVGQCTAGTLPACCADGCRDLDADAANCGACGNACDAAETCSLGTCV